MRKTWDQKPSQLKVNFVCHCNLNSIFCHNLQKLAIPESVVAMHKFDVICLSQTFPNNTYKDKDFTLNAYSLLRADHPDSVNMGGVCIITRKL